MTYKIIFLFLILILLGLASYFIDNNIVDVNGLKIPEKQFSDLINQADQGTFYFCSIKDNDCVKLNKQKIE